MPVGVGGRGLLWLCASLVAGSAGSCWQLSSSPRDNLGEMLALTQPHGAAITGSEQSHMSDGTSEELQNHQSRHM